MFFAWPLVRRWLPDDDWLDALLAAFGLSLGGLSLWIFALSLVPGALSVWSILALPVIAFGVGVVVKWQGTGEQGGKGQIARGRPRSAICDLRSNIRNHQLPVSSYQLPILLLIALPLGVIAVNVLYYPFYFADTLSRYGLFARRIFEAGGLPPAVQGYPLLVSLGYAWAFFAAGAVSDRLAGLISAAFAAGTIGATFALGREMYGRRAGMAAAFLAATSTLFVIWGTSGYVDIPTGFFFALSALFAYRWLENGRAREVWLSGTAAGLAIWTKQAGFMILPSLAAVLAISMLNVEQRRRLLIRVRGQRSSLAIGRQCSLWSYLKDAAGAAMIYAVTIVLVAGPWYLRNYLLSGPAGILPLPGSFYEAQADRRWIALMPFATRPAEWGWPFAILAGLGLLWGLVQTVMGDKWAWSRQSGRGDPAIASTPEEPASDRWHAPFLLAFIVPYHLAWWRSFSYEARFLLTLLPFYAVLAGRLVDLILPQMTGLLAPRGAWRFYRPLLAIACGAIAILGVWPRLGAVYHLAQEPLASEHDILLRLRPDRTLVEDYLRSHLTAGSDSILLMDGSFEYYLTDYRTGVFYPVTLAEAQQWDYLVLPGWAPAIYASLGHGQGTFWQSIGDPAKFREVYRAPGDKGTVVYRVLPSPVTPLPNP